MATQKIETGLIADSAVTTAKLADNSVTAAKIAAGSLDDQVKGISSSADAVAITIDSSENVGIGTDSPSTTLDVQGTIQASESGGDFIRMQTDGTNNIFDVNSGSYVFRTSGFAERMRIDSSGNVAIGASSALDNKLEVNGGDIRVRGTSTPSIKFNNADQEVVGMRLKSGASGVLSFHTDKMVIDSLGNVGIGTTSPVNNGTGSQGLTINGTGNYQNLNLQVGGTTQFTIYTNGTSGTFISQVTADPMMFYTSDTERMRIDSSGNLLVGKTSSGSLATAGFELASNNTFRATKSASAPAEFNRLSDDGEIAIFYKDTTKVGSIGSTSGVVSHIILDPRTGVKGAGLLGSSADANTGILQPVNHSGALADGAIQLGTTSNRFKDLYLSGGAYLGGTGSANKLDDYEEGTWTPSLRVGANALSVSFSYGPTAKYTKIGRMVHVHLGFRLSSISGTSGTVLRIYGLPFASIATGGYQEDRLSAFLAHNPTADHSGNIFGFVANGGNYLEFRYLDGGDTVLPSNGLDSDTAMSVYGIYYTNA